MMLQSGVVSSRAFSTRSGPAYPRTAAFNARQQVKLLQRHCRCRCEAENSESVEAVNNVAREFAAGLVDKFVQNDMIVAVDSGEYCTSTIQEIGSRLSDGDLQGVKVIAACDAAASEAAFVGVPQAMSADVDTIDVMFAEADEVDVADPHLSFVFGRRSEPAQPQIPRFRAAASKANTFVAILASQEQAVDRLGRDLPVVVDNEQWEETGEELDDIFVGDAEIWRRAAIPGDITTPNGGDNPYVAPDGSTLIDVKFYGDFCLIEDKQVPYSKIVQEIMAVPGAKSVGLLSGVATHVALFNKDAKNRLQLFSKEELNNAAETATAAEQQDA